MRFLTPHRALLPGALLLALTSCRAGMRRAASEAPHAAVPAVIDETLKAGEDPGTRQRIALVMATPEMRQAVAEVARAAVAAALDEASTEASEERIAELTSVVARALAESIATDIAAAVVIGARESLRENVSSRDVNALKGTLGELAAASTSAAMRAAATEIPTTVGPAARESLVRELRAPDLHEAITGVVDDATRQVLASSRQAVIDAEAANAATGRTGIIDRVRRILTISWILAFALGLVSVALVAWVLRMRRRTKRYRGALLELVSTKKEQRGEGDSEGDTARAQRYIELLQ